MQGMRSVRADCDGPCGEGGAVNGFPLPYCPQCEGLPAIRVPVFTRSQLSRPLQRKTPSSRRQIILAALIFVIDAV
jgi:hypothetical protein